MATFEDFKKRYEAILDEGEATGFLEWNFDGAADLISPLEREERVAAEAARKAERAAREAAGRANLWRTGTSDGI